MFNDLPLEVVEKILFYLSFGDILSVFTAFNKSFSILSDYFLKTLCLKEDFGQAYENQGWYDTFQSGVNKRQGHYVRLTNVPSGTLEHVYLSSIVVLDIENDTNNNVHNVFFLNDTNEFNLTQTIIEVAVQFKDEYILTENYPTFSILKYDNISQNYAFVKSLPDSIRCVFGINKKYCVSYKSDLKVFKIYNLENEDIKSITLPRDNKIVIDKVLYQNNLVISSLTFLDGYKIKLYNIESQNWTLDLACFNSTGITNDPNIWVGSNFVGCCDVSYRLRGIYFGPFKVWNKTGVKLFQVDIEPSTGHYLRCFFKEENIILTTSDKTITIFNKLGENVSTLYIKNSISDVKLSTGRLIFVLVRDVDFVEVYDWSLGSHLYSIELDGNYSKSLHGDFLYCPFIVECNTFEVIQFF